MKARGANHDSEQFILTRHFAPQVMETTTDELGVLDICLALGDACNQVLDFEDCEKYYERARDGFKEKV